MLSHVKPEDLLDAADYRCWKKLQRNLQGSNEEELRLDSSSSELEEVEFEARSAQAWTHILSQLVKVMRKNYNLTFSRTAVNAQGTNSMLAVTKYSDLLSPPQRPLYVVEG